MYFLSSSREIVTYNLELIKDNFVPTNVKFSLLPVETSRKLVGWLIPSPLLRFDKK